MNHDNSPDYERVINKRTRIRLAVGAIIIYNGKFILVKKRSVMDTVSGTKHNINSYWDFVKGGMKDGEDKISCLRRELKEELGITSFRMLRELPSKLCFEFPNNIKEKIGYDVQETTVFLVEFFGRINEIRIDYDELELYGLFSIKDAISKLGKPESRKLFEDSVKYLQ